jgi:hypothetical protein
MTTPAYIRFFEELGIDHAPLVDEKNASLGEMFQKAFRQGSARPAWVRNRRHTLIRQYLVRSCGSWSE